MSVTGMSPGRITTLSITTTFGGYVVNTSEELSGPASTAALVAIDGMSCNKPTVAVSGTARIFAVNETVGGRLRSS